MTTWRALWVGAAVLLLGLTGCPQQQNPPQPTPSNGTPQARRKPNFEFPTPEVLPHDSTSLPTVKPGHWTVVQQPAKANNFDWQGEWNVAAVNNSGEPLELPGRGLALRSQRQVALPKGQNRLPRAVVYPPRLASGPLLFSSQLLGDDGNHSEVQSAATVRMPAAAFHFVVVSDQPGRYAGWSQLPTMVPPSGDQFAAAPTHYYVRLLELGDDEPALGEDSLQWTSTAYVLWDGALPEKLTLAQQSALVDWLHFGGQLIVSGPNTLDRLKGSFLEPHLPAVSEGPRALEQADFAELNAAWAIPDKNAASGAPLKVVDGKTLGGVGLKLQGRGEFLADTGELLAIGPVGRGRVVVAAFPLAAPEFVNWPSRDGFINAALLGRPARAFSVEEDFGEVVARWRAAGLEWGDPLLNSRLRYFSRDAAETKSAPSAGLAVLVDGGFESDDVAGVAAWDSDSACSQRARASLRHASGIKVPPRESVAAMLAIYLLVVAPVNWLFFWLVGRVEWAWFAAPVLAVVGAIVVIRAAQLDIGFARSRTELAVLELQGEHPRGHLTRYTALYTSLSSTYQTRSANASTLALPMPRESGLSGGPLGEYVLAYRRDPEATLAGLPIISNTTGLLHSEQIVDVGGAVRLVATASGWRVVNETTLDLRGVGVARRDAGKQAEVAWVGELPPEESAPLRFSRLPSGAVRLFDAWDDADETSSEPGEGELSLWPVLELAQQPSRMLPGQVKLFGWVETPPGQLTISPQASQELSRGLVIAHLRSAYFPPLARDANLLPRFKLEAPTLRGDDAPE